MKIIVSYSPRNKCARSKKGYQSLLRDQNRNCSSSLRWNLQRTEKTFWNHCGQHIWADCTHSEKLSHKTHTLFLTHTRAHTHTHTHTYTYTVSQHTCFIFTQNWQEAAVDNFHLTLTCIWQTQNMCVCMCVRARVCVCLKQCGGASQRRQQNVKRHINNILQRQTTTAAVSVASAASTAQNSSDASGSRQFNAMACNNLLEWSCSHKQQTLSFPFCRFSPKENKT